MLELATVIAYRTKGYDAFRPRVLTERYMGRAIVNMARGFVQSGYVVTIVPPKGSGKPSFNPVTVWPIVSKPFPK